MPLDIVYKKIIAERDPVVSAKKRSISVNSQIQKVSEIKLGDTQGLDVEFSLVANYSPNMGKIEIVGDILIFSPKLEEMYDKNENGEITLKPLTQRDVHQAILNDPLMLAISLAREVKLPSPHQLPKIEYQEQRKEQ